MLWRLCLKRLTQIIKEFSGYFPNAFYRVIATHPTNQHMVLACPRIKIRHHCYYSQIFHLIQINTHKHSGNVPGSCLADLLMECFVLQHSRSLLPQHGQTRAQICVCPYDYPYDTCWRKIVFTCVITWLALFSHSNIYTVIILGSCPVSVCSEQGTLPNNKNVKGMCRLIICSHLHIIQQLLIWANQYQYQYQYQYQASSKSVDYFWR